MNSRFVLVAVLLLAVAGGFAWLGYVLGTGRSSVDREDAHDPGVVEPELSAQDALADRHLDAARRFYEAMGAFRGPRRRLLRLAKTASEFAAVCREAGEAGLEYRSSSDVQGAIRPPRELARSSPRVPAVAEWRRLDRAYGGAHGTNDRSGDHAQ